MSTEIRTFSARRDRSIGRMPLPPGTLLFALLIFLVGGIGPNMILSLFAIIVLLLGVKLLWRPGESPVLLFTFAYPWVQGSIAIFHSNWLDISIADYSPFGGD